MRTLPKLGYYLKTLGWLATAIMALAAAASKMSGSFSGLLTSAIRHASKFRKVKFVR
jgi:hypothetical protein